MQPGRFGDVVSKHVPLYQGGVLAVCRHCYKIVEVSIEYVSCNHTNKQGSPCEGNGEKPFKYEKWRHAAAAGDYHAKNKRLKA